ncbi:MAG: ABC transporter substrate-binding protein [Chloroflexi bacterium]|jgi:iron complex transport system substrate-binding protein|nr:ABC transporter substrate-binding protein [Chloroflexota bacterium]
MRNHKLRILAVLVALVFAASLLSACASPGAQSEQRIVCLAPSCVEVIYALGLEDSLVGWSQYTDYPPEVTEREGWVPYLEYQFTSVEDELAKDVAVVSGFTDYNADVVAALNPTLIIATEAIQQPMAEELAAAGYNVLYQNPTTLDEVFQAIIEVGEATGTADKAKKLVDGYYKEIEEIKAITKDLPKLKVYLEISHYGPWATGSGSPMDQIIEIAGGVNIFEDVLSTAFETTNEEIVKRNPDVILTPLWPDALPEEVTTISEIVMREGYQEITAVKNDRVYHYDSSLFKRPGPRQVTAIKKLAYLLHPYYFENPENSVSPWELGKIDEAYDPPAPLP